METNENIVKRLIEIGYSEEQAKSLRTFYSRRGKLDDLDGYLTEKEEIEKLNKGDRYGISVG